MGLPVLFRSKPERTNRNAIDSVACILTMMCFEVGCAYGPPSASPEREFSRTVGAVLGAVGGGILGFSIASEPYDILSDEAIVMPFVGLAVGAVGGGVVGFFIGDFIGYLTEEEEEEIEWYPSTYSWDTRDATVFGLSYPSDTWDATLNRY